MTTTSDTPQGAPFLPPPSPGAASPKAIAIALDDPQLLAAAEVPYLPPPPPPTSAASAPPAFDAKAMVDATKRKVENPSYGQMPAGSPEGRAAADAARARMRRRRHRNKVLGWVMAITFFAVVGVVGFALYTMFQDDQNEPRENRAVNSVDDAARDEPSLGALSPLGVQAEVDNGLGEINSGAVASGQLASQAIADAQQAVDQANGDVVETTAP